MREWERHAICRGDLCFGVLWERGHTVWEGRQFPGWEATEEEFVDHCAWPADID